MGILNNIRGVPLGAMSDCYCTVAENLHLGLDNVIVWLAVPYLPHYVTIS